MVAKSSNPYIQRKNDTVKHLISLMHKLYDVDSIDPNIFRINNYNECLNEYNFYIKNRIVEIQFKDSKFNVLAEGKSDCAQQFKIGKLPCRFLNINEINILIDYLTSLLENRETIVSINDLLG